MRVYIQTIITAVLCCNIVSEIYAELDNKKVFANIAIVDVDEVKKKSKISNITKNEGDKLLEKYQKIIAQIEMRLKEEREKISNIESDEEYKKVALQFDEKYEKFKKFIRELKISFAESIKTADETLHNIIIGVISEIAKENKNSVVLNKSMVVFVESAHDITDDVIESLDKKNIKITLKEEDEDKFEIF